MMCPTRRRRERVRADCSRGADVVSCSWGIGQADPLLAPAIAAWTDSGMVPVFAVGSDGRGADQLQPGRLQGVIGVGASEVKYKSRVDVGDDQRAFSSLGPALVNASPRLRQPGAVARRTGLRHRGPVLPERHQDPGLHGHLSGHAARRRGCGDSAGAHPADGGRCRQPHLQGARTSRRPSGNAGSCAGVEWSTCGLHLWVLTSTAPRRWKRRLLQRREHQSRSGCSASMDDGFTAISGWGPARVRTPNYGAA